METKVFQKTIYDYYRKNKRQFPWRETEDPYKILVSEIMLQQTQAPRVVPKYLAFIERFPDFASLHRAALPTVLRFWQGLGYNRRAIVLKRLAETVVKKHGGYLPDTVEELIELPGIGPYTASAIRAFALNKPGVFIETNIRSVFIHFFFSENSDSGSVLVEQQRLSQSLTVHDRDIIPLIEKTLDTRNPRKWYSALMDYGAMLKQTGINPSRKSTHHIKQSTFKGSDRELRGKILKLVLQKKKLTEKELLQLFPDDSSRARAKARELSKEGFITFQKKSYRLS